MRIPGVRTRSTPATAYDFTVEAQDAAGNAGASSPITVTTDAATTPPSSSGGGGCSHGAPSGLALAAVALWFLAVRRRREAA